jgi:DNA-binding MarR family transcriptional regulator
MSLQMDNTYTYQSVVNNRRGRSPTVAVMPGECPPKTKRGHTEAAVRKAQGLAVDSPQRRRLPPLLRRAWFSMNQTFRRLCAKTGITPDQFTVLRTLHEHEPAGLTQRELAEIMTSDANTIAALLTRMEESGLVGRGMDPTDRRANQIFMKPAGRRKYAQTRLLATELQTLIPTSLPTQRREVFLEELEVIANACYLALKKRN